ncbi:hypothetical protein RCC89_09680 [Cytophagaceae bacterium ABcell3]|nr:hypothetical protein RCC89_09680 [Cytophagaceae bacterium ABcell3]
MNRILGLMMFFVFMGYSSIAQDNFRQNDFSNFKRPKHNAIKTSPLAMIQGPIIFTSEYRLSIEKAVGKQLSAQMGLSYLGPSNLLSLDEFILAETGQHVNTETNGFRLQATFKYFLSDEVMDGFYIGPHFSYSYAEFTERSNPQTAIRMHYRNAVFMGGWQKPFAKFLVIDFFTAIGGRNNLIEAVERTGTLYDNVVDSEQIRGIKLMLGFNIGVAF